MKSIIFLLAVLVLGGCNPYEPPVDPNAPVDPPVATTTMLMLEGVEDRGTWIFADAPYVVWSGGVNKPVPTGTTVTATYTVSTSYTAVLILDGAALPSNVVTLTGDGHPHRVDVTYVLKAPG